MPGLLRLVVVVGIIQGRKADLLVETSQGLVRGVEADDGDYSMYLGVPYGKVDEKNPFGTAHPHPVFDGIYEAKDDSVVCPQQIPRTGELVGNIECLRLNVFVPNAAGANKAVIVWIHGGGFALGEGNRILFGPKFLVRHDVIVVSINYRLGPYGFMCLETPEIPGNQGIKDQVLALKWVNKNIAAFGGDPDKVTIMGESAGSGSVDYHLYSSHEKLYHQAIMQSGTALGPSFIQESDPVRPITIAAQLGFQTDDVSEALVFLAENDARDVIGASSELSLRYRPCVEKKFEGVDHIITKHPLNSDLPKVRDISILTGFASDEDLGDFVNRPEGFFDTLDVFKDMLLQAFVYDDEFEKMENLVLRYYIGDEKMSEDNKFSLSDFQSDYKFAFPIQTSVRKYVQNGARNVYQYFFAYDGGRNFVKRRQNILEPGAIHSDILGYLFDISHFPETPLDEDQKMIDQLTTLWTNFVKYGNPTPETTELLPVGWTPATSEAINYLHIDNELTLKQRPYQDRLAFWELFYKRNADNHKANVNY